MFRQIRARFRKHGFPDDYPIFRFDTQRNGMMLGEDRVFFLIARELGFTTWCDRCLSWDVGHVGELISTGLRCRFTNSPARRVS